MIVFTFYKQNIEILTVAYVYVIKETSLLCSSLFCKKMMKNEIYLN